MGYNPDSNSDAFVGIDDLMAVLSLYGTPFDNGDSVQIAELSFVGNILDTLEIPESADIVYVYDEMVEGSLTDGSLRTRHLKLPMGTGFKALLLVPVLTQAYAEIPEEYVANNHVNYKCLIPCTEQHYTPCDYFLFDQFIQNIYNRWHQLYVRTPNGNWTLQP